MYKNSFLLPIILITATTLAGCSKDTEDEGPTDPFLGEWEIVEATGIASDLNVGTQYDFKMDGSVKVGKGLLSNEGTYTRTETEMTITLSGIDLHYDYTLSTTRLTLDNKSSDQIFILERT
ncbi:MAG: hypothetical protein KTR24_00960 [Saprospiraceae bacterium]|nr:hypothetical protein [Saprospiraceae bacterium]